MCTPLSTFPAGATCGILGDPPTANFYIGDTQSAQFLTPNGCANLCTATATCLAFLVGDGLCALYTAPQANNGFVVDSNSAFTGYDLDCFNCQIITTTATPSTATSSAKPSPTCIPPAGAVCNTLGDFPGDPSPFIIGSSTNPQDTTLAGCSALCSITVGCLSWDLGGGTCFVLNADQTDSGFVANPAGAFEGSDAACLICVTSSSSVQPSATSIAQPPTTSIALPPTTSSAQPFAQPSSSTSSLAVQPAQSSIASAFPSVAAMSALAGSSSVPQIYSNTGTNIVPVSISPALASSIIGQSSIQTAILSAAISQAALLPTTISAATALALSIPGQSSVPIAFPSAPISQASLKSSNYSVSIGGFSRAVPNPSAIASVTSGAVISSPATALPSATPFSGYLRVINPVLPAKRQLNQLSFLKVNIDGTVSTTRSCLSASVFTFGTNGQLTSNGLTAFATTGDIANGISDFTFGLENPANIETTFAFPGDILQWNNNAFTGNQAIFAFPPIPPFVVNAIFDGAVPEVYTEKSFQVLGIGSVAAAEAGCGVSSAVGTTAPTSTISRAVGTLAPTSMTTSTVCTTIVYTITKCPPTVYNCPIGHKTTETIPLYTTVCPVYPAKPIGPIYNIGVLVTIFIDITIEINIKNGVSETTYITDIILSTENGLYNAATSAQPCYPCQLSSQGYKCPKSGVTVTQSVCRSCPTFNSPPTWAAPVVQTCNTCAPITIVVDVGAAPTSPAKPALGLPAANVAAVATPAVDFPSQPAANEAAVATQAGGQNSPPQNAQVQSGGNPPAVASSIAGGASAPATPQQASDAVRLVKITMRAFILPVLSIFWL